MGLPNKTLSLALDGSGASGLSLRKIAAPAPVVAAAPSSKTKPIALASMDPSQYKADIDAWVAKTWTGLSTARWDGDRGGWKNGGASSVFSERALVTYLAEAMSRGSYSDAIARMRQAAGKNASSLSYLSTPFLGGTVTHMATREAEDLREANRLSSLVQAKDASFLGKEGILHFLLDRAPNSLAQNAFRVIADMDVSKLSLRDDIGYFSAAAEAKALFADSDNPFHSADAAAERLVAAAVKTAEGYFLKTGDDGSVDIVLSLEAGADLVSYGSAVGKDAFTGAGQNLVVSALGLADENGFLPAKLLIHGNGGASERSGSISPEDCYVLVVSNPYYPREISFYREIGQGAWAWTCAPSIAVASGSVSCVVSVVFPVGRAHYMALYGFKPFSYIKLYDINYSPDSAFESYDVSGYLYRKASNGLYLKMKHKQSTEKIELYY